jgi:hypothetical protein
LSKQTFTPFFFTTNHTKTTNKDVAAIKQLKPFLGFKSFPNFQGGLTPGFSPGYGRRKEQVKPF